VGDKFQEAAGTWTQRHYMADFLAQRMHSNRYLSLHQCVILAAYILFQAKEHVDGCGGASHIAVLRENKSSGLIGWQQLEAITKILEFVDRETGKIILESSNLETEDDEFSDSMQEIVKWVTDFRNSRRNEMRNSLSFWTDFEKEFLGEAFPKDSLGLPIKPDGQDDPETA
jgi:hypothetical protein